MPHHLPLAKALCTPQGAVPLTPHPQQGRFLHSGQVSVCPSTRKV